MNFVSSNGGFGVRGATEYLDWLAKRIEQGGSALVLGAGHVLQLESRLALKAHVLISADRYEDSTPQPVVAGHQFLDVDLDSIDSLNSVLFERVRNVDTIYLIEVLEHLNNPHALLRWLGEKVNPHAELVICIPNSASLFAATQLLLGYTPYTVESSEVDPLIGGGLLAKINHRSDGDLPLALGHKRIQTKRSLTEMLHDAGFELRIRPRYDSNVPGLTKISRVAPILAGKVTLVAARCSRM